MEALLSTSILNVTHITKGMDEFKTQDKAPTTFLIKISLVIMGIFMAIMTEYMIIHVLSLFHY